MSSTATNRRSPARARSHLRDPPHARPPARRPSQSLIGGVKKALVTVDPTPFFTKPQPLDELDFGYRALIAR